MRWRMLGGGDGGCEVDAMEDVRRSGGDGGCEVDAMEDVRWR
jgi:hypothetical protein